MPNALPIVACGADHRDGLWRCDIHDAAAAERCSMYILCGVFGVVCVGLHSDVSRETSEELARVIRDMRIVGSRRAEVPR